MWPAQTTNPPPCLSPPRLPAPCRRFDCLRPRLQAHTHSSLTTPFPALHLPPPPERSSRQSAICPAARRRRRTVCAPVCALFQPGEAGTSPGRAPWRVGGWTIVKEPCAPASRPPCLWATDLDSSHFACSSLKALGPRLASLEQRIGAAADAAAAADAGDEPPPSPHDRRMHLTASATRLLAEALGLAMKAECSARLWCPNPA